MKNKVLPFPATPSQSVPAVGVEGSNRVIVRIGNQRIALDLTCRATTLSSTAQRVASAVNRLNKERRKGRVE